MTTKLPDFKAFTVIERDGQKPVWIDLGAAFLHKDKAGINVVLQAHPLSGRIILRPFTNDGRKESASTTDRA